MIIDKLIIDMSNLLKDLGIILVLAGVICLVIYYFGVQQNWLLATSLVLEVLGIAAYIFFNKRAE